jgi:hypothetical protein
VFSGCTSRLVEWFVEQKSGRSDIFDFFFGDCKVERWRDVGGLAGEERRISEK